MSIPALPTKGYNTTNTSDSDGYVLGRLNDTLFIIAVNSTFQVLLYGYDINSSNYQILTQFDISDYFSVSSFKVGTGFVTSTHFYLFTELDDTSYLWRSDGTTSGTSLVKTIAAGCGRNSILCTGYTGAVLPIQIPEAEERIVFEGYDSIFGYGLWTSDGSPENTGPLYDSDSSSIRPLDPSYMVRHDDTVYFAARTDETGEELWKTDGTVEGTEITTQIIEGSGGTIFGMASVPAGIAISARNEDDGYEPHLYDGTSMRLLANVQPNGGSYPFDFAQINNKICYVAMSDEYGDEVFCSDLDQTEPNHYLLKNIGPEDSDSNPNTIVSTGERLFFFAKDQEADIYKLWTSDGSQANTIELFSDTDQILEDGRYEHTMVAMGNKVYFHAKDAETEKYGIFYSQGALANTQRLADVETPSASRTQYWLLSQDTLYFQGGVTEYGMEAWQTDGTTAGTTMIFDANPASNSALPPSTATLLGDKIFFIGDADGYGAEPYISDGTSAGTMRLKDINPNSESSAPQVLGVLGDQLIFSAYEPIGGRELWRTDGTAEGTEQIAEIVPGNGSYWISYAKVIGEHIYFGGEDEGGVQLWRTDGTLPGTQKVKEIYPGDDSYPRYFTAFGGQIYFQAESETHGKELWVTDGTENGTSLFADVEPGSSGSYPDNLMASSDHLFFVAEQGFNDYELWATDGNNAPQKLTSLMDGRTSDGVYLYNLATYNNHLYFAATTEAEGTELWKSDGTAAGTALFADFELGPNSSLPYVLYQDDNLLFLSVGTENQGRELWVVDMAAQSFALLKDIATGPANGIPNLNYRLYGAFTKGADGLYYFAASTENEGIELWRTDGTPNGTRLFKDLASGVIGSMPGSLKSTEGFLFFRALHTEFGYETWRYNFPETP